MVDIPEAVRDEIFDDNETISHSEFLIKINRRGRRQRRILLLTNLALYNLLPKSFKVRRRIELNNIEAVILSEASDEFVVHVPLEYDYRFESRNRDEVVDAISRAYRSTIGHKLRVRSVAVPDLRRHTVTRTAARDLRRAGSAILPPADLEAAGGFVPADSHRNGGEVEMEEEKKSPASEPPAARRIDDDDDEDDDKENDFKEQEVEEFISRKEKVNMSHFERLKLLGEGTFGRVFLVKHKQTEEVYAMKILKKKFLIIHSQVEHTKTERQILGTIDFPFLSKLRYAFQTPKKLYLVMDYYSGGELYYHLSRKRKFPEEEARFIVYEVALAMHHLHENGLIYRDMKPENILMEETGHVRVTDFGLSKVKSDDAANSFCGTPEYIAPEVVQGNNYDSAVDWWGVGILLYELVVGIPPFYSRNTNEMYQKILFAPLKFPAFVSNPCRDLIARLLNRNPEDRLTGADVLSHEYFESLDMDALMRKEITPPFTPASTEASPEGLTANFDSHFTDQTVAESLDTGSVMPDNFESAFDGFTFDPSGESRVL
jgi:serine/threonine protein kinase